MPKADTIRVLVIGAGGSEGRRRRKFIVRKGDLVCGVDTRHPAGDAPALDVFGGLTDRQFVNARADRCSVRRNTFGERCVWYRGKGYALMGLYSVPGPRKRPLTFFVLRSIDNADRAPGSVPFGSVRWKRHLTRVGRFAACALAAAVLLASAPWFGSKPNLSGAPPADRAARSIPPGVLVENHRVILSRPASPRTSMEHRRRAIMLATSHPRFPGTRSQQHRRLLAAHLRRNKAKVSGRTASYTVGFGTFRDRWLAEAVARRVRASGYRAIVSSAAGGARVRGHRYPTRTSAARSVRILRAIGLPAGIESSNVNPA